MRFWDTSAIVPLLVDQATSAATLRAYRLDPDVVVWWATAVECVSALTRLEREGSMAGGEVGAALDRLGDIARAWHEVQPTDRVRQVAGRLLRVHPLRAADAFQLAAAIASSEDRPGSIAFVTLDVRLAEAADREGFAVVGPAASA